MISGIDSTFVLGMLPARPRLLALGEPTHFEDKLLDARNDLFRQLVEREGFRAIAIESDCLAGLLVDDYVTGGDGDLDAVMDRGFSHEFGRSAANRDLVRWLRDHNAGRPAGQHVHFAGFDGPWEMAAAASPRQVLTALHAAAGPLVPCTLDDLDALIGEDDRWTNPAAMMDPTQSVGRTPGADRLRLLADDLAALVDAQPSSGRARLYARTATGLLRYHHGMADTSPARLARLLGVRSAMMAANLLAVTAEWGPAFAHAQNAHFQRPQSSMTMAGAVQRWWSAGALAACRLGPGYAFLAGVLGEIPRRGVGAPPPDTLEGLFCALPGDRHVADPRRLEKPAVARVSPWFGYAPFDPEHLGSVDGLVFVR